MRFPKASPGKKGQRAIALPLVLVFMVISHLIYLGIIQLNAYQGIHLKELNTFYQARVQENMALEKINPQIQEKLKLFELVLLNQAEDQMRQVRWVGNQTDAWQLIHPHIWIMEDQSNHRLALLRIDVFVDQAYHSLINPNSIRLMGSFKPSGLTQVDPKYQADDPWLAIEAEILKSDYRLVKRRESDYTNHYNYFSQIQANYAYEAGGVQVMGAIDGLRMTSFIDQSDFTRTSFTPLSPIKYQFKFYYYEWQQD